MKLNKSKNRLMMLTLLVGMITLTGCMTTSSEELSTLSIYQTEYLDFKKGQQVQTKKGIYTVQFDQTFVSLEKFRKKEAENIALVNQVRKLTAEHDLAK